MKLAARHCLLLAVLLAGCTHFEPKPLSPEVTAQQFEERSLTNPALKTFLDRTLPNQNARWPLPSWDLDALTLAAFYYQPSLDVARAEWRVAQGGIQTAKERPNPTTTVSLLHEPVPDAPSPWIPAILFDLPIETAGKRRLRTDLARHLAESAQFNVQTTAWQVRSQLRTAMVDYVSARQRLTILQRQASLHEQVVARLRAQLQAGAISTIELNVARLALVRARADLADAERAFAEARPHLATAIGVPAAALDGVEFQFDLALPRATEEMTSNELRRLALLGRADILGALADYAASQSSLQSEIAKQYPDIHVAPGYSWNAGSAGEHDWQIGATVELPLLNQHKGAIVEAAARREASAARFRALQSKVIGEIDVAVAAYRATQTNAAVLEALRSAQATQLKSAEAQLQAGAVDRLGVLASQLELNTVELSQFEARVKVQQAVGGLEDAIQRPFELPAWILEDPGTNAAEPKTKTGDRR
jgi:outer membrane protein TolC